MELTSNKDNVKGNTKNSVFTPEDVQSALDNLPFNYAVRTREVIEEKVKAGTLSKNYSKKWIKKVRDGDEFNEHILEALIEVGNVEIEKRKRFGLTKKTPSA